MIGSLPRISFAGLRSWFRAPSRPGDRLVIAVFALFLTVPLAGSMLRKPRLPVNENRKLHPKPDWPKQRWQYQVFPRLFELYFGDRIGFRRELLALRRQILLETLGDSTTQDVWVGHGGWLFTNTIGPFNRPYDGIGNRERVDGWVAEFERRRKWLADRRIRYLVVVAPEKSSVYPEFLPDAIRRHPPPDYGAVLKERLGDLVVDPIDALLAAKATTPQLYFQRDTHWTDAGAYIVYRELESRLARELPGFRAKLWDRFLPRAWHAPNCDLARALGRPEAQWSEEMPIYDVPHDPYHPQTNDPIVTELNRYEHRLQHVEPFIAQAPSGVGRVLFLHDSFGHNLKRMWASDFRRLVCAGTYGFPEGAIEREKPEIVVQLLVARAVIQVDPKKPSK